MLKYHDLPTNAPPTKKPSRVIVYLKTGDIIIGNPHFQHEEQMWVYSYGGAPNSSYGLMSLGACHIPLSDVEGWDYIDEQHVETGRVEIKRTFKLTRNPGYSDGSVVCISFNNIDLGSWSFELGMTFLDQKSELMFSRKELNQLLLACSKFAMEEMKDTNV